MKNVSDKFVQKIKTHISCSVHFSENRAVYEIMWKNMVVLDRPQMTIEYGAENMRCECPMIRTRMQIHIRNI